MKMRLLLVVLFIATMIGCVLTQQSDKSSSDEAISVDITGMTPEQQETAGNMIKTIVPLVREGKTEGQIIQALQEIEAKKITRYRVEVGDSWTRGPDDAKVTIVEFSDFQCPFCGRVQTTLKKIRENYPNDVRGYSCLIKGKADIGRTIHIVCSPKEDYLAVITAYIPSLKDWEEGFEERKR